jgi:hypothetical protein
MPKPIELVNPGTNKGALELNCSEESFELIRRLVIEQLAPEDQKRIPAKRIELILAIHRAKPEQLSSLQVKARNIGALWGCGLVSYLLIMAGVAAVGLMGLGIGVVMGWLKGQ